MTQTMARPGSVAKARGTFTEVFLGWGCLGENRISRVIAGSMGRDDKASLSSWAVYQCLPGHPGIGVDVEGGDGASEARSCLKEPHFHVGTGIPFCIPIFNAIKAQP